MAFLDPAHPELIVERHEAEPLVERLSYHFMRKEALSRTEYEAMIADLRTTQFEPAPWDTTP